MNKVVIRLKLLLSQVAPKTTAVFVHQRQQFVDNVRLHNAVHTTRLAASVEKLMQIEILLQELVLLKMKKKILLDP
jgi:hypothetical protein